MISFGILFHWSSDSAVSQGHGLKLITQSILPLLMKTGDDDVDNVAIYDVVTAFDQISYGGHVSLEVSAHNSFHKKIVSRNRTATFRVAYCCRYRKKPSEPR